LNQEKPVFSEVLEERRDFLRTRGPDEKHQRRYV